MRKRYIILTAALVIVITLFGLSVGLKKSSCSSEYGLIESLLNESNFCEKDSDCSVMAFTGKYLSFGCYAFVNVNADRKIISDRLQLYPDRCSAPLEGCTSAPNARCTNNKCIAR